MVSMKLESLSDLIRKQVNMANVQPVSFNHILTARRFLVFAAVLVIVMVLATVFITIPQIGASFEANSQRIQAEAKLVKLRNKVRQLETASDPQFQSQMGLVNALLPSKKPLVEALSGINTAQIASQAQVVSIELNPGEIATDSAQLTQDVNVTGPTTTLTMYLTIQGTLNQINQFLEAVERTTPLITVTELTLTPLDGQGLVGGDESGTKLYSARLTLDASYFIQSINSEAETDLPQVSLDQQRILNELGSFTVIAPNIQQEVTGGGLQDLFGLQQPSLGIQQ